MSEGENIIWHYTNVAGLQQIMTPGAYLYGTHYRFFSDVNECIAENNEFPDYTYFITCFTEKKDNYKLWGKWKNKQYCIGFDKNELLNMLKIYNRGYQIKTSECKNFILPHIRLCKVLYNKKEYDAFIKTQENITQEELVEYIYRPILKKINFKYEEEWRIFLVLEQLEPEKIEYIGNKPRLPLIPILHKTMIKEIISVRDQTPNVIEYEKYAKDLCRIVGLDESIVSISQYERPITNT